MIITRNPTNMGQESSVAICPSCQGKEIYTDYFTDEIYCIKCGLVLS